MDAPTPMAERADPDHTGIHGDALDAGAAMAQLSDSLRLLAPALHLALDRILAHFSPAVGAGTPPSCSEELAQLCNQIDQLIHVLQVVDATAAVQLLSRLRALLVHCAHDSDPSELQLTSSQAAA
ncbi:hypothetical protein, partial [Herbaspirillum sp. YR522]|uniref:hypothetical protein n=1 Tax=Herbaspirillum sp. YR522 TaxID=1144342 RepID=UPI00026F8863